MHHQPCFFVVSFPSWDKRIHGEEFHPHFTEEGTEAQRGLVISPRLYEMGCLPSNSAPCRVTQQSEKLLFFSKSQKTVTRECSLGIYFRMLSSTTISLFIFQGIGFSSRVNFLESKGHAGPNWTTDVTEGLMQVSVMWSQPVSFAPDY